MNYLKENRLAGILCPIFSLPSNYGIGSLGKEAYRFADFLEKAGQSYWQILPVGPTSYGDSPYQSFSSWAGNPYFIDLDLLVKDKLLNKKDLKNLKNDSKIDYAYLYQTRFDLLRKAYLKGKVLFETEFIDFKNQNEWLKDYALFMAIKQHFKMKSWLDWPIELKRRDKETIVKYQELLKEEIEFYEFIQYLFYKQFYNLKKYLNEKGIKIIGDIPIYVALDSCDVWANTEEFLLDEETLLPKEVAGVPPDYFSKDGQLWGNPLYNWKHMKDNGYKFWIDRISGVSKCFDVIRIDHFRGFQDYWAVDATASTAKDGHWCLGPSLDFIKVIRDWFYNLDFVAEDLGIINDDVKKLLDDSGFPGMRVMEFGTDETSIHVPHNYVENCVCYISTHDNIPIMGYLKTLKKKELNYLINYYGLNETEGYNYGFIRGGMASIANTFICQIQDYLGIDEKGTINRPGTLNNWTYRLDKNCLSKELASKIKKLTKMYGRRK